MNTPSRNSILSDGSSNVQPSSMSSTSEANSISRQEATNKDGNGINASEPPVEMILSYLRKRGLGRAIIELQSHIDQTKKKAKKNDEGKLEDTVSKDMYRSKSITFPVNTDDSVEIKKYESQIRD